MTIRKKQNWLFWLKILFVFRWKVNQICAAGVLVVRFFFQLWMTTTIHRGQSMETMTCFGGRGTLWCSYCSSSTQYYPTSIFTVFLFDTLNMKPGFFVQFSSSLCVDPVRYIFSRQVWISKWNCVCCLAKTHQRCQSLSKMMKGAGWIQRVN